MEYGFKQRHSLCWCIWARFQVGEWTKRSFVSALLGVSWSDLELGLDTLQSSLPHTRVWHVDCAHSHCWGPEPLASWASRSPYDLSTCPLGYKAPGEPGFLLGDSQSTYPREEVRKKPYCLLWPSLQSHVASLWLNSYRSPPRFKTVECGPHLSTEEHQGHTVRRTCRLGCKPVQPSWESITCHGHRRVHRWALHLHLSLCLLLSSSPPVCDVAIKSTPAKLSCSLNCLRACFSGTQPVRLVPQSQHVQGVIFLTPLLYAWPQWMAPPRPQALSTFCLSWTSFIHVCSSFIHVPPFPGHPQPAAPISTESFDPSSILSAASTPLVARMLIFDELLLHCPYHKARLLKLTCSILCN